MTKDTTDSNTLVNGRPAAALAVSDRGLAYGDGLFETMLCVEGRVPLLERHLSRLKQSCKALGLETPNVADWMADLQWLFERNDCRRCMIKLIVTRGTGAGYAPPTAPKTTRVVQLLDLRSDAPSDNLRCEILTTTLGSSRLLAGMKHLNRLEQVLAAIELKEKALQEGLLCNEHGFLIEAVSSNVLLAFGDKLVTPKLDTAGVRGVMRDYLIEQGVNEGLVIEKDYVFGSAAEQADEIILCNSVRGVRRVAQLGERIYKKRDMYTQLSALAEKPFDHTSGA